MEPSANDRERSARRILALVFPYLPTERIIKTRGQPEPPFVLTEKQHGAMVIAAADRQGVMLGLGPGIKLADARARVPELLAFDHDPRADAMLLERLAAACERYTPMVSITPPEALILDITGASHFYASEQALARDSEDRLDAAGYGIHWALAGTADAALALARHGLKEGAEAQLPVAALDMDAKTHQGLERAGLYHIGDLTDRPRAGLAARFGMELTLRLDRLLGTEDRPIDPLRRLGHVTTERRFAEPLTHVDSALEILGELFAEAAEQLNERGQGARIIAIQLFRCDGDVAKLGIETGAPTRDAGLFKRLLRERIDALNDKLNPGFGYDLIRLTIVAAEPLATKQLKLEGGEDRDDDEIALVSQLSVRLGRERVQKFGFADSHIPEQGLLALAYLDCSPAAAGAVPHPGHLGPSPSPPPNHPQGTVALGGWPYRALHSPPDCAAQTRETGWGRSEDGCLRASKKNPSPPFRPLRMFDPPQRVQVIAEVPDGPPHHFTWRRKAHRIIRYEGPERIASEWWRRKDGQQSGKGGLTRDYYRVEDSDGRRFWLFRHGLYGSEKANPDWYVHGLFG